VVVKDLTINEVEWLTQARMEPKGMEGFKPELFYAFLQGTSVVEV
jgi:hypothetical protein